MTTSIPYSTGWHLQIDGRNAETFRVNTGFVGAQVPEGHHFIKLKYETPGFKPGILLSIAGIIWWVIFSLIYGMTLLMKHRK
jgi:uncharacterized membrane protein YfhO